MPDKKMDIFLPHNFPLCLQLGLPWLRSATTRPAKRLVRSCRIAADGSRPRYGRRRSKLRSARRAPSPGGISPPFQNGWSAPPRRHHREWLACGCRKPCCIYDGVSLKQGCRCGEMADARDLKSRDRKTSCGFESHHRHQRAPQYAPSVSSTALMRGTSCVR